MQTRIMGNTQNILYLEQTDKNAVSASDSTLLTTIGSTNNKSDFTNYDHNYQQRPHSEILQHQQPSVMDYNSFNNYTMRNESPCKTYDYKRSQSNQASEMPLDGKYTSPQRYDFHGSPIHFSDQSTDNESGLSDTYKNLLKRDYLALKNNNGFTTTASYSNSSSPSRVLSYVSSSNADAPFACEMDINLDYTIHVGKLAIYIKQLRFNINRVEEFVIDGYRIRGKVKCTLVNQSKCQKSTSNVFEAVKRNGNIVHVDLDESFVFFLFPKNDIPVMSVTFKVYICKKLFREFNLGEKSVKLGDIDLKAEMYPITISFGDTHNKYGNSGNANQVNNGQLTKEKRSKSLQPVFLPKSEKLEILLSLEYNTETSKLIVNVDQTTKLDEMRYESKREIIFQAELVSPSCECVQRKTTFLKISEDNPGSNKHFEFDLPQEDLLLNTLMLSASYSATRWLQQEKIGWIAFGRNCSGQVEAEHWDLMISQSLLHEPAIQWHCLCECPDVNKSHTLLTRVFK